MKKVLSYALIILLALDAAGCATVQKKFTRKKKEPKHVAATVYLQQGAYQKKYSNDYYYKTHFTLWKTWHDELLLQLGGNQKKVERCAQEALGNLTEINRYLVPEKQAELKPSIDEMSQIVRKVEGIVPSSQEASIRFDLERLKRVISNNFYYEKVKASIIPEDIEIEDKAEDETKEGG